MTEKHLLAVVLLWLGVSGPAVSVCSNPDVDFEMKRLMSKAEPVCQTHAGKVRLIVNVASHCGFTPQYEGLEAVSRKYKAQGLVVLGFPSADFGGQEFEDDAEIQAFCKLNFGVSFPMYARSKVNGADANPLFKRLAEQTGKSPQWNFNKYLIGRDGRVIAHYPSDVDPQSPQLAGAIESALAQPAP